MADDDAKKVEATRRRLAEIARDTLDGQMGWPSNAVWWYEGAAVGQDPKDGSYFVMAKINKSMPMDNTGWPYGLPHTANGVQVRSSRAHPEWHQPGLSV